MLLCTVNRNSSYYNTLLLFYVKSGLQLVYHILYIIHFVVELNYVQL